MHGWTHVYTNAIMHVFSDHMFVNIFFYLNGCTFFIRILIFFFYFFSVLVDSLAYPWRFHLLQYFVLVCLLSAV